VRNSKFKSQSGQTLVEAVVVIAVGTIVVGALVFATIASLRNSQVAKNQSQATKLAQEGIEKVRASRDRASCIGGSFGGGSCWTSDTCPTTGSNACAGPGNIWGTQMTASICVSPYNCYFKINSSGDLDYISSSASPPSGQGESLDNFTRYIILSDDANYTNWKNVISLVIWNDFSGIHESRVSTVLRKL